MVTILRPSYETTGLATGQPENGSYGKYEVPPPENVSLPHGGQMTGPTGENPKSEEKKLEDINKPINEALAVLSSNSYGQDMADAEMSNRYAADQATRRLAQTLAGRGMADSGVAAEMSGQLGGQYARDLAEEFMSIRQKQKDDALKVAQLLMADKWNTLNREQQIKMQEIILEHQKELAEYLNALQQGNPGMIEGLTKDFQNTDWGGFLKKFIWPF